MREINAGGSAGTPQVRSGDAGLPARRSFFGVLLGAGMASVGGLLSIPLLRFVLHPLLSATTPVAWSEVGNAAELAAATAPIKKLTTIEQRDGWRKIISERAVYVTKEENGRLVVLSSICPHLGCSVTWQADKGVFLCPCHGGLFAPDGKRLGGPPPRGMDVLESKVEEGVLKVQYQYFRQLVRDKEILA
jgi:menaquinol-cytochrome c reductase iron-sulfur subunit